MNAEHEWDLILRCRSGSTAAFEPLVRAHEGRALLLAETFLGDRDDAADVVQEAFVKAYRSLGRLREGSRFGPWLRTIVRNRCRDRLRSPGRRGRIAWNDVPPAETRGWAEAAAETELERGELATAVRSALGRLSAAHREVLVLKEVEGLSYGEIAEETGVSAGTVASRIHHARKALREVLLAEGVSLEGVDR